jgi:type II secretory pathway component PulF
MTDARDRYEAIDWVLLVPAGLGLLVVAAWLPLVVVPSFGRMFSDFGGRLPGATMSAILRWPIVVTALPSLALLARALTVRFARVRRLCLGVSLALTGVAFCGWLVALYLPIWQLAGNIRAD